MESSFRDEAALFHGDKNLFWHNNGNFKNTIKKYSK